MGCGPSIHLAALRGDLAVVQRLCEEGADKDTIMVDCAAAPATPPAGAEEGEADRVGEGERCTAPSPAPAAAGAGGAASPSPVPVTAAPPPAPAAAEASEAAAQEAVAEGAPVAAAEAPVAAAEASAVAAQEAVAEEAPVAAPSPFPLPPPSVELPSEMQGAEAIPIDLSVPPEMLLEGGAAPPKAPCGAECEMHSPGG